MEEEHESLSDSTFDNDIDDSCNEEDHEIHNDSATSSSTISILERLKSPTSSDFARKRKVRKNPPVDKKRSK